MDTNKSITRTGDALGHNHDHHVHGPVFAPAARTSRDMTHIQGWAPTSTARTGRPYRWSIRRRAWRGAPIAPPSQQPERMEIFVSPERPHITPLFGTSAPPKGISGMLRRLAYKMTENDIRHFMLLLLADRINVVEGIGEDLMKGHVPNVLGEMGIKAEWEHNRVGLVKKAAVATAVVGIGYYLLKRRDANR